MMEWLTSVPDWVRNPVIAAIGWLGKSGYDTWKKNRLPFKQDQERYHAVIDAVQPANLHHFRDVPLNSIGKGAVDGIDDSYEALSWIRKSRPAYLHGKLRPLEDELFESLRDLCEVMAVRLFVHHVNLNVYTMYWDRFDEWSQEDAKRFQEIRDEFFKCIDRSIGAFEAFRDAGNRLFADRLVRGKADG